VSFRRFSPFIFAVLTVALPAVGWSSFARAASFSGQIKSTTDAYPESLGSKTDDVIPYLSADLSGKHKFTRSTRLQWRLLGMSNLVAEGAPEKFYGDVPEAFIEKKLKKWKFRAGMNTLNWGVVDVSSPSDQVNTSALMHPLRSLKRGAPMIEASYDRESFAIDAFYIPIQRRRQQLFLRLKYFHCRHFRR
jgi:hypothetical protein